MPPTMALAQTYASEADVQALLSVEGEELRLDDNQDGIISAQERAVVNQAISYATSRVNLYCQTLYDVGDLVTSWTVNEWTTIMAARWVCKRRGNPVPEAIEEMFGGSGNDPGVMGELKMVRAGQLQIPDIGYRNEALPWWSNVRVDKRYRLRQIRVERPISDKTPPQYSQNRDIVADYTVEPN